MPTGPMRPCRSYACAALVTSGYCAEHQPLQSQVDAKYRGSAKARGYDSTWRKLRDWVGHEIGSIAKPDEIRFGDNDRLAALLSHLVSADVLVLLTDTPGLYTADPRTDPSATLITDVRSDDPLLAVDASGAGSNRGSGGMASKLSAARIASWSGVRTVIAKSSQNDVLERAAAGAAGIGTTFHPHDRKLSARKLWIAFAAATEGIITVDPGARDALVNRGVSLLPAGVVSVQGSFEEGDNVDISDLDGVVFARGMAAMSASTARSVAGKRTSELPSDVHPEIVHRDDLVILP